MLALSIRRNVRNPRQRIIVRGLRMRHFGKAFVAISCTVSTIALLLIPNTPLRWGWWRLMGGQGNVVLGATTETITWHTGLIGLLFVGMVLAQLPCFVLSEERDFRRGDESRTTTQRVRSSLRFGLWHMIMGIPIGAALGLSVAGMMFSQTYLSSWRANRSRAFAILECTRVHLAYNMMLLFSFAAALVLSLILS